MKQADKTTDQYFSYVRRLADYLEDFLKRTRPLEDLEKFFTSIDRDFEEAWEANGVLGWGNEQAAATGLAAPVTEGTGEGIWCPDCEKEFKNDNVYKNHLSGKKHIKAAEARKERRVRNEMEGKTANGYTDARRSNAQRLKERAIAEREYRVKRLAANVQGERADTRINVERKQGMTERERQLEIEALFAESTEIAPRNGDDESDSDSDEKIYNPLKLPLAWDGKPIPYWLYKLHGLGVEFSCEICGNFVYMGRRAFDKHFNEARHIYGLKCLGITNTTLFREITGIEDALKLWDKIQRDKKKEKTGGENIVQMEDADGNVMPEKVYYEYVAQTFLINEVAANRDDTVFKSRVCCEQHWTPKKGQSWHGLPPWTYSVAQYLIRSWIPNSKYDQRRNAKISKSDQKRHALIVVAKTAGCLLCDIYVDEVALSLSNPKTCFIYKPCMLYKCRASNEMAKASCASDTFVENSLIAATLPCIAGRLLIWLSI